MARALALIAKIAFCIYCVIAIGAISIALAYPPWERTMDAMLGFVALLVAALPWSIVVLYATEMLEIRGVGDTLFAAMNVGFVLLNLYLLYWLGFRRGRGRPGDVLDAKPPMAPSSSQP
jgi:hypothetical protein